MLTFISCAKTISSESKISVPFESIPIFQDHVNEEAIELAQFSTEELEKTLRVNTKIALINHLRYTDFFSDNTPSLPAILAYSGIVFKRINPSDFTTDDFLFAQENLRISSFLYGILRPLDKIKPYRLEGNVNLMCNDGLSAFDYWKKELTDLFINKIKDNDGILINLASDEMKSLFEWERVKKSVKIITPDFKVIRQDKPKSIVMYTKMCRGEMVRYIIKNRVKDPEILKDFNWEGFQYNHELSEKEKFVYNLIS